MENLWISKKLERLKKQYDECDKQEIALSRYIGCMIRMLNGLAQMEYSQFHFYERLILWDALEIFTEYFLEQIDVANHETDIKEKRILIDDIENAVDRMTGVYKNVIDSTANSDRQILSSISIDTSIYELSPKICAFYSMILDKLVKMFEGNTAKYAFVLHPTLKNNTESQIMFECRKKSGKVVIIYISESIIEMFDVVSVFLVHEAFHVLTKKERKRENRTVYFMQMMLAGMRQRLFKDVVFDNEERKNKEIEEKLFRLFFADCKEELLKRNEETGSNRKFYSKETERWGNEYFYKRLKIINRYLERWVREIMSADFAEKSYKEFQSICDREDAIINRIQENLLSAIFEKEQKLLSETFMSIFKEIYADIACVLTLQLKQEDYEMAFEKSKQFHSSKEYCDIMRMVRNYIVAESVADYLPTAEGGLWKEYAQKLSENLEECGSGFRYQEYCEKDSTNSESCVMLIITPQMKKSLLDYAKECAEAFSRRLASIEDIQSFRDSMLDMRKNEKRDELMEKIMIGDFSEIF